MEAPGAAWEEPVETEPGRSVSDALEPMVALASRPRKPEATVELGPVVSGEQGEAVRLGGVGGSMDPRGRRMEAVEPAVAAAAVAGPR